MEEERKREFPPLLAPGRHEMSRRELRQLCVEQFGHSTRRAKLFVELSDFIDDFSEIVPSFLCYIDGSFITTKLDPDDIDLHVVIEREVFESLSEQVKRQIEDESELNSDYTYLFVTVIIRYEYGHEYYRSSCKDEELWMDFWSVGREKWLKGVPIIRVGESDVGLRILHAARP
jgi:hypothetical protein